MWFNYYLRIIAKRLRGKFLKKCKASAEIQKKTCRRNEKWLIFK